MVHGLIVNKMSELRDDIKMHLDLDRATPTHVEYWEVSPYVQCFFFFIVMHMLLN